MHPIYYTSLVGKAKKEKSVKAVLLHSFLFSPFPPEMYSKSDARESLPLRSSLTWDK